MCARASVAVTAGGTPVAAASSASSGVGASSKTCAAAADAAFAEEAACDAVAAGLLAADAFAAEWILALHAARVMAAAVQANIPIRHRRAEKRYRKVDRKDINGRTRDRAANGAYCARWQLKSTVCCACQQRMQCRRTTLSCLKAAKRLCSNACSNQLAIHHPKTIRSAHEHLAIEWR